MMADIAVVSDRATFRVPELLRGIPDATYAAALPAHVGHGRGPRPPAVGPAVRRGRGPAPRVDLAGGAPRPATGGRGGGGPPGPPDRPRRPGRTSSACSTSVTATSTTRPCSGPSTIRTSRGRACGRSWRSARPAGSPRSRRVVRRGTGGATSAPPELPASLRMSSLSKLESPIVDSRVLWLCRRGLAIRNSSGERGTAVPHRAEIVGGGE